MEFKEFAEWARRIESESGNAQTKIVSELFENSGEDLEVVTRFVRGQIFPTYDDTKTSMGPSLVYGAISSFAGIPEDDVEDKVVEKGDAGAACEEIVENNDKQDTLGSLESTTVGEVYDKFKEISETSGSGSESRKKEIFSSVLYGMTPLETKYLVRIILGDMRLSVGEGTVRDAIAEAFEVSPDLVERAYMMSNDYGMVARTAEKEGEEGLRNINMVVGQPVNPMKAKSSDAVDDIVGELEGEVAAEVKFDGARLQIHKDGDDVSLFTRGLNDETSSLPDVVEKVRENVDSDEVILDSEVVAYEDGKPLDFNEIQKRLNRKHNVEEKVEEINVDIKVFDILYNEGEVMIDRPLSERREVLEEVYPEPAESYIVEDEEDIQELREMAVNNNNEGLIVKSLASPYTPDKRGKRWIKVKPEAETIDCVVTGGQWGKGNREGWIGTYEISVLDGDGFSTVGKVGNGMTEEQMESLTERFEPLVVSEDGLDLEFKEEVVFEVSYEDIQESPEEGLSLRFPVLEEIRTDKGVRDADTIDRLRDIKS